jgi:hypothetical protein
MRYITGILPLLLLLPLLAGGAWPGEQAIDTVSGTMKELRAGTDSFELLLAGERGEAVTFTSGSGAFESLEPGEREDLKALERSSPRGMWPGKTWPTAADLGSRVRIHFVKKYRIFLSYEVVRKPESLWVCIVASVKTRNEAEEVRHRIAGQGFSSYDCLNSSDYPALKAGFFVVICGASPSPGGAEVLREQAWRKGCADAYVKKLW